VKKEDLHKPEEADRSCFRTTKLMWSSNIQQRIQRNCRTLSRKVMNPQRGIRLFKLWGYWWTQSTQSMFWSG